jgi:hypothetical protein
MKKWYFFTIQKGVRQDETCPGYLAARSDEQYIILY